MSVLQTTSLGAVNTAVPSDDTATTGALAAAAATSNINIMQIVISNAGAVTYQLYGTNGSLTGSATEWATVSTAVDATTLYYGIQNSTEDAQANEDLAGVYDCTITTNVYNSTASAAVEEAA